MCDKKEDERRHSSILLFFFSSRRRHTRFSRDWSSDVCSSDLDNSSRYFEYYFGRYPSIIRKNRTSIAVLNGTEGRDDYKALGQDIFQYFGLGCRNISKLYLKNQQQLQDFLKAIEGFHFITSHHKYLNNYEYNKAI